MGGGLSRSITLMETDLDLLSRYHRHGDAEAFQVLVAGHAGMVHATACRVTRDAALAEDVAQETFLALARSSGAAIQSVGAWLHHVAWQKAQNVVRGEARRQNYESAAAAQFAAAQNERTWAELEPLLDEALDALPEATRALLIERFLEGRSQNELAARTGVSQSTVSRQLDDAIHQLRLRLRTKGVIGAASLTLLLSTHSAQGAPAVVTASLGKLALSGVGAKATHAVSTTVSSILITMTSIKKSTILICLLLCLVSLWFTWTAFQPKALPVVKTADSAPKPKVSSSSAPKPEKPPAARKPLTITSKGKVRLKPGESAVLGYWEIAPGMNGMAIVTPETTPEGHVKMTAKLLQMSDAAVADADADDLFPDIFDFENYSAIDPQRLGELQSKLQSTRGADMLSIPTVTSLLGQPASISIGNSDGTLLSLDLKAEPVASDGGYDLSMGLQRQE